MPTDVAGTFTGVLTIQKTNSSGGALKVKDADVLKVVYEDAPGHTISSTADVLKKTDKDQPATLYHDLIYIATDAQNFPVMAVATDDIRVQKVTLYYRIAGSGAYLWLPMDQTFHNAYTALIPATTVTPLGLEYYIQARDSKGTITSNGSAAAPNFVVVQPRTLGLP